MTGTSPLCVVVGRAAEAADYCPVIAKSSSIECTQQVGLGATYLPSQDWGVVSFEAADMCVSEPDSWAETDRWDVAVLPLVNEDLDRVRSAIAAALDGPPDLTSVDLRALVGEATRVVLRLFEELYSLSFEVVLRSRLGIHEPFLRSTSFNIKSSDYMGLHYDQLNASGLPIENYVLTATNLGYADRYLSIVPPRGSRPDFRDPFRDEALTTTLATTFLGSSYPDVQSYRITQRPLDAYVMDPARLIHDGATNQEGLQDIVLFVAGIVGES